MLKPLTSPPRHISIAEHAALTSQTPTSFTDIPPVLHFTDEVEVLLLPTTERIRGTIWVTEEVVAFLPSDPSKLPGFEIPYTALTLHALSPASSSGDLEAHLYCQATPDSDSGESTGNGLPLGNGHAGAGDDDEGEYDEMVELRIFTPQPRLQPLFEALSSCSALHASLLPTGEPASFPFFPPDENGEFDDAEEDENGEEEGEDEHGEGGGGGRVITESIHRYMNRNSTNGAGPGSRASGGVGRFLDLVDWGNVDKPPGWDEMQPGGDEGVEDLEEVIRAMRLDVSQTTQVHDFSSRDGEAEVDSDA